VHEQPMAGEHLLPAVTPTDHCDNTACEVSIGGQLSPEQKHAHGFEECVIYHAETD